MLRVKNISKKFNGRQVLNELTFCVNRGDFVVIMGPNGTGKSTLFDSISGKIQVDQGTVFIDDIDITKHSEKERASYVGRLFQNTYLGSCAHLTVRENLAMACLKGRKATLKNGVKALLEEEILSLCRELKVQLENLLDVPMGALSGGQRQIISFIMAVSVRPKVMLLDEPTAALDPNSATELLSFAKNYAQMHGVPTLLITHDPLIAKHLGNRLWILQEGAIQCELGLEKSSMNPQEFFQHIDYGRL